MAICGLRADSFPFGLLEGGDFRPLLSILERAEQGFTEDESADPRAETVEALRHAGLLKLCDRKILLQPEGARLLESLRSLIRSDSTPS